LGLRVPLTPDQVNISPVLGGVDEPRQVMDDSINHLQGME
jgi:hypothetical protein